MSLDSEDIERIAKIKRMVADLNLEVGKLPPSVVVSYHMVPINQIGYQPVESLHIHMLEKL